VRIVAGAAFALFKGEMHILLQQLFLYLGMALKTIICNITLDRSLSSGGSQRKAAQQKNAKGIHYSFIHVSFIHVS
jgi:hypothetical protein